MEETADADLLVHVVDISDKNYNEKMQVVNDVLKQIHADKIPQIIVFNKIDKVTKPYEVPRDVVLVSAKNNLGIEKLREEIENKLFGDIKV